MNINLTVLESIPLGLVVGGVGYLIRGIVEDRRARKRRREQRHEDTRHEDRRRQRELLIEFLGQRKAHFYWLLRVAPENLDQGDPPAEEKVRMIADWVYENGPRFPEEIRGHLMTIANAAYWLLDPGAPMYNFIRQDGGYHTVHQTWKEIEEYKDGLTSALTGAE